MTDTAFVKRAATTIQQFFLWPCPFSLVARDVLTMLKNEAAAPGACMRQRLLEDATSAAYVEDTRDEKRSALYYFMDAVSLTLSRSV